MNELKIRLLNAYKELYEKDPEEYNGAVKISNCLSLPKEETGSHHAKVHHILDKLAQNGCLEQKKGQGFRLAFQITEEQINKKAKKAQEELLQAVLEFFKNNPDRYFGSKKVTDKLNLIEGHNYYFVHGLLDELKKRDKLTQKKNSGFKLRK